MGNENSATTEKNSNATTRSSYKRTPVPGPLHPNYQPPVANDNRNNNSAIQSKVKIIQEPVPSSSHRQSSSSRIKQITPTIPVHKSAAIVNKEHSSPVPSKKSVTLAPTAEQSFAVLGQQPQSPFVEKQRMSSPSFDSPLPYNNTSNTVTSASLEKAPVIKLNFVAKSSNSKSIHTYGPDDITIMSRTSSQAAPHGTRWYDNGFNKSVKPIIDKYL